MIILILAAICGSAVNRCSNFGGGGGGVAGFRISELEVHGANCSARKQDFQQCPWPPSAKNKNKCLRNKLHPVVLQSTYQSCQLGPIPLEQKKHNRPYFLNSKVQLNMVTWQTDRGALSFLSERGNLGTFVCV